MFTISNKTIFAIAPHLDDVELGVGGTLHYLASENNNKIYYIGLSMPPSVDEPIFMEEFRRSTKNLQIDSSRIILKKYDPRNLFESRIDILQFFYDLNKEYKPDIVFIPNSKDIHQSHEVAYAEARRAFKFSTLLGYELPWNSMEFDMDVFITLREEDVIAKINSINAYKTQSSRLFFSNDIVGDLARVRGKQINRTYAECFELIRMII